MESHQQQKCWPAARKELVEQSSYGHGSPFPHGRRALTATHLGAQLDLLLYEGVDSFTLAFFQLEGTLGDHLASVVEYLGAERQRAVVGSHYRPSCRANVPALLTLVFPDAKVMTALLDDVGILQQRGGYESHSNRSGKRMLKLWTSWDSS